MNGDGPQRVLVCDGSSSSATSHVDRRSLVDHITPGNELFVVGPRLLLFDPLAPPSEIDGLAADVRRRSC
jgi:hypothetical protein